MARPQQNNKNNNKKQNNDYFSKSIQQKGEGFIQAKTAQDMQRDAIRIFRDIARGNIDLQKYSNYFLDQTLLQNMIAAAQLKLSIETIKRDGVSMLYNMQLQNPAIVDTSLTSSVFQNQIQLVEAYTIILTHLTNLSMTNDTSWLFVMASDLNAYKYIL